MYRQFYHRSITTSEVLALHDVLLDLPAQQAAALHGHRQQQHAAQTASTAVAPDPYMAAIMEKLDKLTAAVSGGSPLAAAASMPTTTALDRSDQSGATADEVTTHDPATTANILLLPSSHIFVVLSLYLNYAVNRELAQCI
jgi:hypothetical protein